MKRLLLMLAVVTALVGCKSYKCEIVGGVDNFDAIGHIYLIDMWSARAVIDSAKLDNLIQIGHNVEIGENTVSSSQTGIAGTTKVGSNCFIAGQVGIADHIVVGNRVKIGAKSGIDKNVPDGEIRFGSPALSGINYHRSFAVFKELPELRRRVMTLEAELAKK